MKQDRQDGGGGREGRNHTRFRGEEVGGQVEMFIRRGGNFQSAEFEHNTTKMPTLTEPTLNAQDAAGELHA